MAWAPEENGVESAAKIRMVVAADVPVPQPNTLTRRWVFVPIQCVPIELLNDGMTVGV